MDAPSSDLRSRLGKVRGLGSAKHGVGHWWLQRVTAVALIPLTLWFVRSLVEALLTPDAGRVADWLSSPLNAIGLSLMLVAGFIHARLGVQVVIEDYVKCPVAKYTMLLCNTFVCYIFAALCVLAVLKLHFLNVVSTAV